MLVNMSLPCRYYNNFFFNFYLNDYWKDFWCT